MKRWLGKYLAAGLDSPQSGPLRQAVRIPAQCCLAWNLCRYPRALGVPGAPMRTWRCITRRSRRFARRRRSDPARRAGQRRGLPGAGDTLRMIGKLATPDRRAVTPWRYPGPGCGLAPSQVAGQ